MEASKTLCLTILNESKSLWKPADKSKEIEISEAYNFYKVPDNTKNKLVSDKGKKQLPSTCVAV